MKLDTLWKQGLPVYTGHAEAPSGKVDVAVVGGGFCGLSAALALARRGASVALLEARDDVAAEASGRNGGHVAQFLSFPRGLTRKTVLHSGRLRPLHAQAHPTLCYRYKTIA